MIKGGDNTDALIRSNEDSMTVSARELHEKLNAKTRFNDWFPRMVGYGFTEHEDFNLLKFERVEYEGKREVVREVVDYAISIDMAKQICMIQRSEIGKKIRQYFIDLEKAWNTPEQVMARALKLADKTIASLKEDNEKLIADNDRMKPKEIFADAVSASEDAILIGALAKMIKQNGKEIGQKRLFEWLRQNSYLMKDGADKNLPTQRSMEMGLFKIKERTVVNADGSVRLTRTPQVTGKGQQYFINKFLAQDNKRQ